MPWRLLVACVVAGVISGATFGFFRGLRYLPTLPFAIGEGAILFSVPAFVLGIVLVAGWRVAAAVHRR